MLDSKRQSTPKNKAGGSKKKAIAVKMVIRITKQEQPPALRLGSAIG